MAIYHYGLPFGCRPKELWLRLTIALSKCQRDSLSADKISMPAKVMPDYLRFLGDIEIDSILEVSIEDELVDDETASRVDRKTREMEMDLLRDLRSQEEEAGGMAGS